MSIVVANWAGAGWWTPGVHIAQIVFQKDGLINGSLRRSTRSGLIESPHAVQGPRDSMNPFNLGIRNLVGILFPGGLLLMTILGCIAVLFPGGRSAIGKAMTAEGALVVSACFLLSYVVGSVLRLYSANLVDHLSVSCIRRKRSLKMGNDLKSQAETPQYKDGFQADVTAPNQVEEQLERIFSIVDSEIVWDRGSDLSMWVWKHDRFPYPVWEWLRFRLCHPPDMVAFYKQYKGCFIGGSRGREFFNYCRLVVFGAKDEKPNALAEEVQAAEAYCRFLSGTFFALAISSVALLVTAIASELIRAASRSSNSVLIISALLAGLAAFAIVADGRFRRMRIKEVDTVFDAFFLVHRHPNQCELCDLKENCEV